VGVGFSLSSASGLDGDWWSSSCQTLWRKGIYAWIGKEAGSVLTPGAVFEPMFCARTAHTAIRGSLVPSAIVKPSNIEVEYAHFIEFGRSHVQISARRTAVLTGVFRGFSPCLQTNDSLSEIRSRSRISAQFSFHFVSLFTVHSVFRRQVAYGPVNNHY
jgi:hypothetical protein